jgi:hypothetical protein
MHIILALISLRTAFLTSPSPPSSLYKPSSSSSFTSFVWDYLCLVSFLQEHSLQAHSTSCQSPGVRKINEVDKPVRCASLVLCGPTDETFTAAPYSLYLETLLYVFSPMPAKDLLSLPSFICPTQVHTDVIPRYPLPLVYFAPVLPRQSFIPPQLYSTSNGNKPSQFYVCFSQYTLLNIGEDSIFPFPRQPQSKGGQDLSRRNEALPSITNRGPALS